MPELEDDLDHERVHEFVCENCGQVEHLSNFEAFMAGWDYPPFMGMWGVVMPRTCPGCYIGETAWWKLTVTHEELTQKQIAFCTAIAAEDVAALTAARS